MDFKQAKGKMKKITVFARQYLRASISCLYLFTIGIFSSRHRCFISTICYHFGCKGGVKTLIPRVRLSDVLSDDLSVHLHSLTQVDGNISPVELLVITKLVQQYQPKMLFEIGTFDGKTTLNMAANCSAESKVYTLDLPKNGLNDTALALDVGDKAYINKETSGSRYWGTEFEKKITQFYGDSAKFDFSPFYGKIDFAFVDGSHAYDYVLHDTEEVLKLMNETNQSIILWHDYGEWNGVTRALNELYRGDRRFSSLKHIDGTSLVYMNIKR
ncbi:MAG: class I SAM-dependent methyltransferase [bacterium]